MFWSFWAQSKLSKPNRSQDITILRYGKGRIYVRLFVVAYEPTETLNIDEIG